MTTLRTKRRLRVVLLVFLTAATLLVVPYYVYYRPPYSLYYALTDTELEVAHDYLSREQDLKFVVFNQLQGAGFNNQVQEILLYHHLALVTSRTYVYQPFIWRPRNHQPLPLSAFLPNPTRNTVPISLLSRICPEDSDSTVHITVDSLYSELWDKSQNILNRPERCIIIDNRIMHWNYLASPFVGQMWPSFQAYLSKHFEWSPQIIDIVKRTQEHLELRPYSVKHEQGDSYMAIHIRRGDFSGHCASLAESEASFTTWANLPSLQSSVLPPALDISHPENVMLHCYSPLGRILDAITLQARRHPHIRTLHILHDAAIDHPIVWLDVLKLETALTDHDWAARNGWGESGPIRRITHTGMIPLQRGEYDFEIAVDVELARLADVFIGNGYSSLSSQIIALRMGTEDANGDIGDITLM
ncbi:hypothetical protein D9758_006828 [Tetrapyrgos nigripes]|uniref:Uncharacterized protein n=1 Tax=Tetrapyrgos nigripes TaxID=182062 RepID=A0A8H5CW57_9AGAR|nr:hypothetical protein D9758_006828 [Tetrapyrgos nigripes]